LAATQVGRLLHFSDTAISTVSWFGLASIRIAVWIPANHPVLRRRLRQVAFQFHRSWWADLLAGMGITSLGVLASFTIAVNSGWLVVEGWMCQSLSAGALAGRLWVSLLINALVALGEEIAFRAYLLTGLKQAWGNWIGCAVMAVAFALPHTPALEGDPPFTVAWALVMLTAFGAMFGWAYMRTGSLWLPIGIHFAWDFVENDLLNLSGDMTNPHVVGAVTRLVGPSALDWMANVC
jgi:membrane protease YdiL (CAAX protease family)